MNAFCVFNVGDRRIGIPMASVREILEQELVSPTPLPLVPDFVHGLCNLRGQVLPWLDLSAFVGATRAALPQPGDRTVIVERGNFRFATRGQDLDSVEVAPDQFQPLADTALYPALDVQARGPHGTFDVVHVDRLEACLAKALNFVAAPEPAAPAPLPSGDPATSTLSR